MEIRRWFDDELVDGLRVDHPDGLRDPGGYLDDLAGSPAAPTCSSRRSWSRASSCPTSWATAGTTGYDALALVDRVLTDPAGEEPLTALDDRLRGAPSTGRR